jgi:hypothetical protein
MTTLRPRFPPDQVSHWASRFADPDEAPLAPEALRRIRRERRLRKSDLIALARWKTPRSRHRVASNPGALVEAVTRIALTTKDEKLRIVELTRLAGIGWPTASVILHFCHPDPYPILDVRALWSLGVEKPQSRHGFNLWWTFTRACRRLARGAGCSMRTLDRALWQYSKERQARTLSAMKKAKKAEPRAAKGKAKKKARRRKPIMRHSREG